MSSYAEYKRTFGRKKGDRDASGTYHSPVSSASGDSQDEGFLKINENTTYAKWDGDQTKYVAPDAYQNAKKTAELAYNKVMSGELSRDDWKREAMPLAKDIASATKEVTVAATTSTAKYLSTKLNPLVSSATKSGKGLLAAGAQKYFSTASPTPEPSYPSKSRTYQTDYDVQGLDSAIPAEFPTKSKLPTLSAEEQMAIFEAHQLGQLKTTSLEDKAVGAFLGDYRQKAALDKQMARRAAKKAAQEEGGLVWVEEDDEGEGSYDALGVSGTFRRPGGAFSDREDRSWGPIEGYWAAKAEEERTEEIPLSEREVVDQEEAEEMRPEAYPKIWEHEM